MRMSRRSLLSLAGTSAVALAAAACSSPPPAAPAAAAAKPAEPAKPAEAPKPAEPASRPRLPLLRPRPPRAGRPSRRQASRSREAGRCRRRRHPREVGGRAAEGPGRGRLLARHRRHDEQAVHRDVHRRLQEAAAELHDQRGGRAQPRPEGAGGAGHRHRAGHVHAERRHDPDVHGEECALAGPGRRLGRREHRRDAEHVLPAERHEDPDDGRQPVRHPEPDEREQHDDQRPDVQGGRASIPRRTSRRPGTTSPSSTRS